MMRDLPGQMTMFEEAELTGSGFAEPAQRPCMAPAPAALGLPRKPTCTVGEAAAHTGISKRQLRYYVEDGTLLAVNAARVPVGTRPPKGVSANKLDSWRIVVRRGPEFGGDGYRNFLTLEEFLHSRLNREDRR